MSNAAFATDVVGTIVLQKAAPKRSVSAGIYDLRGVATQSPPAFHKHGIFDHVAVWLELKGGADSIAPVAARMQQLGRQFQPDFLLVPVGSTIDFPNGDPIFHNIFSLSRSQAFDLGYYAEGKSRHVTFTRPGVVQVYCHIHSDMYGVIVVVPSVWGGIPDSNGVFSFRNVPPGEYSLLAWQRTTGLVRKKVKVAPSETVHLKLSLPDESDD